MKDNSLKDLFLFSIRERLNLIDENIDNFIYFKVTDDVYGGVVDLVEKPCWRPDFVLIYFHIKESVQKLNEN